MKRIRLPPCVIGSGSNSNADCCPVVVSIPRQTPEVVGGTGAVILPLVDYAAVSRAPKPLSSRSRPLLTLTIRHVPSPPAIRFQCSLLAPDTSLH